MTSTKLTLSDDLLELLKQKAAHYTLGHFLTEEDLPDGMAAFEYLFQNPDEFDFSSLMFCEQYEHLAFVESRRVQAEMLEYYRAELSVFNEIAIATMQDLTK